MSSEFTCCYLEVQGCVDVSGVLSRTTIGFELLIRGLITPLLPTVQPKPLTPKLLNVKPQTLNPRVLEGALP